MYKALSGKKQTRKSIKPQTRLCWRPEIVRIRFSKFSFPLFNDNVNRKSKKKKKKKEKEKERSKAQ